tara:strand:+ start:1992 stop:3062 length:1071 start_codon:yes stop_codon:yes gene_type:complete
MVTVNNLLKINPFSMKADEKSSLFNKSLFSLNNYHYNNCKEYKSILNTLNYNKNICSRYEDFPYIHVSLFKDYNLSSISKEKIYKIMNSSGTSGQKPSTIYLDKNNSIMQTKVLTKLVSNFIGNKRLPMLIIDSKNVISSRKTFSARGAGIIGFSIFGKDVNYALDEDMNLDIEIVTKFLNKYQNQEILIFGFTYILWKYFINHIIKNKINIPRMNGYLIHGGGWKKLLNEKVDNNTFKDSFMKICGINNIINYYGMVEQTGSIFLECSQGYLHTSIFSDILTRRQDYSICDLNEVGLVQLISLLPTSYPGHNIISDDLGMIIGIDDCKCGRSGKYFLIHGRIEKADLRGCSDTIE